MIFCQASQSVTLETWNSSSLTIITFILCIQLVTESCFTCYTGRNYSTDVCLFLCKLLPTGEIHLFAVWNKIKGLEKSAMRNTHWCEKSWGCAKMQLVTNCCSAASCQMRSLNRNGSESKGQGLGGQSIGVTNWRSCVWNHRCTCATCKAKCVFWLPMKTRAWFWNTDLDEVLVRLCSLAGPSSHMVHESHHRTVSTLLQEQLCSKAWLKML